jgi:hypothetical protein
MSPAMQSEPLTTLDDFRVRMGVGRVILMTASLDEDRGLYLAQIAMTTDEARQMAADLIARAERVERERR